MKIGIVCYPTFGGSGVIATELALKLIKKAYTVHLICYQRPVRLDRDYENLTFHQAQVKSYSLFPYPFYTLSLASKICEVIQKYDLDLLHVHYAIPHAVSSLLARLMSKNDVKIVVTLHGTDIHLVGADPSYKRITKWSLEQVDGITAVSNYLQEITRYEFGVNRPIKVIYNFVDIDKFSRHKSKNLRGRYAEDKEKIIVHVSNFRGVKRVPDLIEIFRIILRHIPAKLLLIGDGPERVYIEEMVKKLPFCDKILFLGEVNDIQPILSVADLFLLTSEIESFGLVCLEAMACCVPVVATHVGGLPEVIENGKSGFLVRLGDIEKMAELSLDILKNDELSQRLGEAGRKIAEERFSIDKIVSEYCKYYEEVLNK